MLTIKLKVMPTRKEAEEYKKRLEKNIQMIYHSRLPKYIKDQMIDNALDKWKAVQEALEGLGIPLEEEQQD